MLIKCLLWLHFSNALRLSLEHISLILESPLTEFSTVQRCLALMMDNGLETFSI